MNSLLNQITIWYILCNLLVYLLNSLFSNWVPLTTPSRIIWRMWFLMYSWILRDVQAKWDWGTVERSLRSRLLMGVLLLLLFMFRLLLGLLSLFDFEPMKLLSAGDCGCCCCWWWWFCAWWCFLCCCWFWWRMLRSVRDKTARCSVAAPEMTNPSGSSSWSESSSWDRDEDWYWDWDWSSGCVLKLWLNSALILWFAGWFTLCSLTALGTKLLRLWSLCR